MKTLKIASICANTRRVSRTRLFVSKISDKVGAALSAHLVQFSFAEFSEDLRTTPYRTALEGEAKAALNTIEAADALIVDAPVTRLGSCPSIFLHLLELSDPDRLLGKPTIFIGVGSAGVAPHLVKLRMRLLSRIIGLKLVSTVFASKAQLCRYPDDPDVNEQISAATKALNDFLAEPYGLTRRELRPRNIG